MPEPTEKSEPQPELDSVVPDKESRRPAQPDTARAWRRVGEGLARPGRSQIIVALVLALVSFAVVTQVRSQNSDDDYSSARREDLVQLLDQLNSETRRLEQEQGDLERTQADLKSGANAEEVARAEAQKRADMLAILSGTAPAEGPGIRLVINDPESKVTAEILLDAIEEMRDAGGEVIEFNDKIRLVASSSITFGADGLIIDNMVVTRPITMEVIGDAHSLSEAARFRGGLVSEITGPRVNGTVDISELSNIRIDSLHTPKANQYARPADPPR